MRYDEIGNEYGYLSVVSLFGRSGGELVWLCECRCGTRLPVCGYSLRSGHTKSCGCLRIELGNCHWETKEKQQKNRRKHKAIQNFSTEDLFSELARRGATV